MKNTCDTEDNGTTTYTVGMEGNPHHVMDNMTASLKGVENHCYSALEASVPSKFDTVIHDTSLYKGMVV